MLPTSCPSASLTGPEGGARTLNKAGNAAEAAYEMQRAGKPRRCCRGAGLVTAEDCLAKFRAGEAPCVTPQHGRCTTGLIEDAKHLEDTMGTKSKVGPCANPVCPDSQPGSRVKRYSHDLCWVCFKRLKAGELVWPPAKLHEQPKKAEASAEEQGCRPSEEVQVQSEAAWQDHCAGLSKMVTDLPEDLDRPFSLGGFDFGPAPHRRMVGSHLAAITAKSLSLRTGVINEHDLGRYDYARIAVSTDGKALAVKFYTDKRPGARKIQLKRRSNALIAMEPLVAQHPEWIGREAPLESMGVEGWFLMRVGEKAA